MKKFTPGPWRIEKGSTEPYKSCLYIYAGTEVKPTWLADLTYKDDGVDNESNANLIAAAPDMYEALKKVDEHFNALGSLIMRDLRLQIKAALNKANPQT